MNRLFSYASKIFKAIMYFTQWLLICVTCISITFTLLTTRDEDIRNAPKKINVISETIQDYLYEKRFEEFLSGKWESDTDPIIIFETYVNNNQIDGFLTSPSLIKKILPDSPYKTLLIDGFRKKNDLYINIYEFILGKRSVLANLRITCINNDIEISDKEFDDYLEVRVINQKQPFLPERFHITKLQ